MRLSRSVGGAVGDRAALCLVASVQSGGVQSHGAAAQAGPAQGAAGAATGVGGSQRDRRAAALCRDLNHWWEALWTFTRVEGVAPTNNVAERAAACSAVAQGQLRDRRPGGEPVRRENADRGSDLPEAGTAVIGFPGDGGRGCASGNTCAIAASHAVDDLNGTIRHG